MVIHILLCEYFIPKFAAVIWVHYVCLVETNQTMYNLTPKGQTQNLTCPKVGMPFHAPRWEEHFGTNPTQCLYLNPIKSYKEKCILTLWFQYMTSMFFSRSHLCKIVPGSTIAYLVNWPWFGTIWIYVMGICEILNFSPSTSIGRSWKWPDPRSMIHKFQVVGTEGILNPKSFKTLSQLLWQWHDFKLLSWVLWSDLEHDNPLWVLWLNN